jgi:hypothetical protein
MNGVAIRPFKLFYLKVDRPGVKDFSADLGACAEEVQQQVGLTTK